MDYDQQPQQPAQDFLTNRVRAISDLLDAEDRANSEYISGQMDKGKWQQTLKDIDDRLSVVGLRLARMAHTPPF